MHAPIDRYQLINFSSERSYIISARRRNILYYIYAGCTFKYYIVHVPVGIFVKVPSSDLRPNSKRRYLTGNHIAFTSMGQSSMQQASTQSKKWLIATMTEISMNVCIEVAQEQEGGGGGSGGGVNNASGRKMEKTKQTKP